VWWPLLLLAVAGVGTDVEYFGEDGGSILLGSDRGPRYLRPTCLRLIDEGLRDLVALCGEERLRLRPSSNK